MLGVTCIAQSEVFRHVDKNGQVSYSNSRMGRECTDEVRPQSIIPDLCGLDRETRESIKSVCSSAKYNSGPAAYARCINKQLSSIQNSTGIPDLSGLDRETRESIKSVCSSAKYNSGPAAYERCIRKHLASIGLGPGQSPNVVPTPPARNYVSPAPVPSPQPRVATPKPPQRIDPNKIINASSGSGFAVSTSGHVITNNHVIKGCKKVKIHSKGRSIPAKVIAYDSENDIALLKGQFKPSTFFRFSTKNAQLLQEIYVAGYPFGRDVSNSVKVTKGIVSALIGIKNNTNQIQIDAALQPGNSGGPIIDATGNVVGIAVSKLSIERTLEDFGTIPENTNFGVKSSVAKSLLQNNNVNLIAPIINPITTTQLGDLISNSTYYLSCWMTVAQIQEMRSQKVLFNNLD